MLMEDEFESSCITLAPIFGQLSHDTQMFVLLNGARRCEIARFFEGRPWVHFSCLGRNLGVAGGRNLLCREALCWGADILVCYDNDFLSPDGYFGLISLALVELARFQRVGVIAPALVDGNACTDYWKAHYDNCSRARNISDITPDHIGFGPEDLRRFLRGHLSHIGPALFYHLGIRDWRRHYLRGYAPEWKRFRDRLCRVMPVIPASTDPMETMLIRDPQVQEAVLNGSGPVSVDTLPGGAHCYFSSLLRELGGYDDNFNPYGFEDSDFCIRALRAGYHNYLIPAVPVIHDVAQRHRNRTSSARLRMRGRGRRILLTKFAGGRARYYLRFAIALLFDPLGIFRQELTRCRRGCERFASGKACQGAWVFLQAFLKHRFDRSKSVHNFPLGRRRLLFVPHNAYHTLNMSYALPYLRRADVEALFVNIEGAYRNEGAQREIERLGLPYVDYSEDVLDKWRPDLVVVMNDWGGVVNRVVMDANSVGIPSVAIVEGVQDFEDTHVAHIGVGRIRRPYRTARYVLAVGDYDRKFLGSDRTFVVGLPRIEPLLAETPVFPDRQLVAINCNFTYGLYTDQRQGWIEGAVQACRRAGIDYVITQHHADDMDLAGYPVTREAIHDVLRKCTVVVSRFSTVILEAMALGKPVVYHNPHDERVDTFKSSLGAYRITRNSDELASALREAVTWGPCYRERSRAFFRHHVSVEEQPSGERMAAAMIEILKKEPRPTGEPVLAVSDRNSAQGKSFAERFRICFERWFARLKQGMRNTTG